MNGFKGLFLKQEDSFHGSLRMFFLGDILEQNVSNTPDIEMLFRCFLFLKQDVFQMRRHMSFQVMF